MTRFSLVAALLVLSLVAAGCGKEATLAPQAQFAPLSGEQFAMSDLRGKVVLVNFWATTCVSCMKELPRMIEAYRKFAPRGYEVVAVAMSYDEPQAVAEFTRRRGLPFRVAVDTGGQVARSFGEQFGKIAATPSSFLIDRQGRVVRRFVGEPDWAEFHEAVERALAS